MGKLFSNFYHDRRQKFRTFCLSRALRSQIYPAHPTLFISPNSAESSTNKKIQSVFGFTNDVYK